MQTAELVERGLEAMTTVDIVPALAPDGMARDLVTALATIDPLSAVLLVGHEPSMSAIGALLARDADFPALGKAQAARIVNGELRWRFAWDDEAPAVMVRAR